MYRIDVDMKTNYDERDLMAAVTHAIGNLPGVLKVWDIRISEIVDCEHVDFDEDQDGNRKCRACGTSAWTCQACGKAVKVEMAPGLHSGEPVPTCTECGTEMAVPAVRSADGADGVVASGFWLSRERAAKRQERLQTEPWTFWQLSDDPGAYGTDAGLYILTSVDGETEVDGYKPMDYLDAQKIVVEHNARLNG